MALVNEHYLKLPGNYLFSDIAKKNKHVQSDPSGQKAHPSGYRGCDPSAATGMYHGHA